VNIGDLDVEELRTRLLEAESNLHAIYCGEIDALLLADENGERRVFTLRSADAPYRALVERMQEGAATLSLTGDIVYCNQRFAELVRVPLEHAIGASIGKFLPAAEGEILRAMLEHGSGRYQTRLVLNGQEATEVQVTLSSIVLDDVEHRTLILSDISSLARAQRENRSKDEFLAMLAHELRNPLGAIQGAVHALGLMNQAEPMALRATSIIKRQVVHMARLVDDLLDVGRAVTGKIVLKRQPLNLAESVKATIATIASGNPNNHARVDLVSEPVWVSGDPVRLTQVICNLLTNAAKFSTPDQRIAIALTRNGDSASLCVENDGVGIPAELVLRIFERFVQGEQAMQRASGGLGLGLAIAKNLVELHGGTIAVESAGVGQGARFTVTLPTVEAGAPAPAPAIGTGTAPSPTRLLVVDDNDDAAQSLALALRLEGHEVETATDGDAALRLLDRFRPAAAILDIGLPTMNGYELARALRDDPRTRAIVLIALTGYGRDPDRRRALDAGFDEHLVKPVEFGKLLKRLDELLAGDATIAR